MKRIFALVLSFVFLLSCLVLPAGAMFDPSPVYQVQAASAYIVNTDTNIIVYDKDSTKQVSAGGLTKYMTLAVLLTNYADQLDSTFQMPFAISDYVYNTNNADMRSNETFTYREAMYAMLTRNANEAAMGVAYTLSGGDLDGWVAQMNTLSQRIGTTASSWTDACGIDSGNTTCAVDMYLILRYLKIQIRPHFYMNCLNFIYSMIDFGQYDHAKSMSRITSDYLAYIFRNTSEMVPVTAEMNHCENYLKILLLRYPEKFTYYLEVHEEVKDAVIFPFLIQVFVENAAKHALTLETVPLISVTVYPEDRGDEKYVNTYI